MIDLIKADLYRYTGKDYTIKSLLREFRSPCFRYTYFLRRYANEKSCIFKFIYKIIVRLISHNYGFQIPVNCKIGKGFYIAHFGNIVINENAIIGNNCNITHGVTIGRTNRGILKGNPIIGSKVWIGANAIIIGKIEIGDNVLIAPGAFVNFNVPCNSIVIGNPGKIISKNNAVDGYINNVIEDF